VDKTLSAVYTLTLTAIVAGAAVITKRRKCQSIVDKNINAFWLDHAKTELCMFQ